ncbi:MAG: S-layer homology domain-containing protein [Clostridiales bacterium]|nr:S-layer homology domain-containing protein [Clostridiales bacterium]
MKGRKYLMKVLSLAMAIVFVMVLLPGTALASDADTVYASIREAEDGNYMLSIRNAKNVLTIELWFKPEGFIDIYPLRGFSDSYDFDREAYTFMYRSGSGIGFTSEGAADIGQITCAPGATPTLVKIVAVGYRNNTTVYIPTEIEEGRAPDKPAKPTDKVGASSGTGGGGTGSTGGTGGKTSAAAIADTETPLAEPDDAPWFEDVLQSHWFYGDVRYVHENSLMNGTSTSPRLFSPNATLTRGMVVTVLYRQAGSQDASGFENPFNDIEEGAWYTPAVKWALEYGIVYGYGSGEFGPNDNVTREQLAVILKRYAGFRETNLPELRGYESFSDEGAIAGYATDAVEALFKAGVINGKPNGVFDPQGTATRAEFAAMLHRFLES